MIINLILLGSALGVSYQSWRKQRKTYNKKLFDKHQKTTTDLKENINLKKNLPVSSSTKKRTNSKEFASLVTAMGLSSIGYVLYYPLSYFSVPFILFAVRKKLYSAWGSVKKGKLEVETLAIITIFGTMIGQRFFIGSLLAIVNAIGDILISRVIRESHHQLVDIYQDMPKMVWLLKDNLEISILLSDIQRDDILVVNAGEMISADGEIVWGGAGIDEHRLTGESMPVEKNTGEKVFAMTVVLSGKIHFKIEQAGAKTSAMKIANIINETSDYKSLTVLEYETFSSQLIKPALITSMIALPVLGLFSIGI
jgi:Cu2+-exporting ATPase